MNSDKENVKRAAIAVVFVALAALVLVVSVLPTGLAVAVLVAGLVAVPLLGVAVYRSALDGGDR